MQLIERENYKTVLNFTDELLPDGIFVHLWLMLQISNMAKSSLEALLLADIWPNPNILCVVDHPGNGQTNIFLWSKKNNDHNLSEFLHEFGQRMKIKNTEYWFGGIPEYHKGVIETFIGENCNKKVSYHYQFWIPPEKRKILLRNEIRPPDGYYFDILKLEEAKFVDDHWPHQFPGSLERMKCWIEHMPNVALRVNGTGELAAFELLNDENGLMTHLYTLNDHRRKGLGAKVEEKLAQLLITRNIVPVKNVGKFNEIGKIMTDKSPWWNDLGYFATYFHIYSKEITSDQT